MCTLCSVYILSTNLTTQKVKGITADIINVNIIKDKDGAYFLIGQALIEDVCVYVRTVDGYWHTMNGVKYE